MNSVYLKHYGDLTEGELTDHQQLFSEVRPHLVSTGFKTRLGSADGFETVLREFKKKKYRKKTVEKILETLPEINQGIIFAVDTDHANKIATEINEIKPGSAQAFHESKFGSGALAFPEKYSDSGLNPYFRAEILRDFRAGKFKLLVGVLLLAEGVDFPKVDAIYLARPTYSTRLLVQMVGRGMRGPAVGGTTACHVFDFTNQHENHNTLHQAILTELRNADQEMNRAAAKEEEAYQKELGFLERKANRKELK